MNLYFDLDTGSFTSGPGIRDQVSVLTLKRGDTVPIVLRFLSGGVVTELGTGATGKIGIKALGDYDGDFLAAALSWTKAGTGLATTYNFTLNLSTTALNNLLGVGAGADVASVTANFELEYIVSGVRSSSNTILLTILNDIVRGDESGVTEISEGTPVNAEFAALKLEFDQLPADGDTLVITDGTTTETWTFKTTPTDPSHIEIGADFPECAANLVAAWGSEITTAALEYPGSNIVDLLAYTIGTAGNSITVTSSNTGLFGVDLDEEPLAGGIDATPGRVGTMKADASHLYVVASVSGDVPTWKKIALSTL